METVSQCLLSNNILNGHSSNSLAITGFDVISTLFIRSDSRSILITYVSSVIGELTNFSTKIEGSECSSCHCLGTSFDQFCRLMMNADGHLGV